MFFLGCDRFFEMGNGVSGGLVSMLEASGSFARQQKWYFPKSRKNKTPGPLCVTLYTITFCGGERRKKCLKNHLN